jgi:tRNA uridine 5-carboxymethylaminomethyl modification enzyme
MGIHVNADGVRRSVADLLRLPGMNLPRLSAIWPELTGFSPVIAEQIEIDARYAGYLDRQEADIRALRRDDALKLPADLDYASVGSLSTEIRLALTKTRPATLGAASRIPGVTPAALAALLRHVKRRPSPEAKAALAG